MNRLNQLRTEMADLQSKIDGIAETLEREQRGMNEAERTEFNTAKQRMAQIEPEITELQSLIESRSKKAIAANPKRTEEERSFDTFSIHNVIRAAAGDARLDGVEREWDQEIRNRNRDGSAKAGGIGVPSEYFAHITRNAAKRDFTATGGTGGNQGGDLIATNKGTLIDALSPYLVLDQMGVQKFSGLVGNLSIPKEDTAATAVVKSETGAAADVSTTFDTIELTPHRIPAEIVYTFQMMAQSSVAMDQYVNNRILKSIANGFHKQAIQGTGTGDEITGLITALLATGTATTGGSIVESAGTLDWDTVVDLEAAVDTQDALMGALWYLTSAKMRGKLKSTTKDSGSGLFIWDQFDRETPVNGYGVKVTNHVPDVVGTTPTNGTYSPLIFGNFGHFAIAQWGDIWVDLVNTNAKSGSKSIVVNSFWDAKCLQTKSFSMVADIATTTSFGS